MKYMAVFRIESVEPHRIGDNYDVEEYALRPCMQQTIPEGYRGICSNFLLLFPFEGTCDQEGRNRFRNKEIASLKAKAFVAWFVLITRTWARLTGRSFGTAVTANGRVLSIYKIEDFNEDVLEGWGIDRNVKSGEYEVIQRPELTERTWRVGEPFKLPSDFPELTRKLFSLKKDLREKFLNACFSYQFAFENWVAYPTVSILALVSSVESMMEGEPTSQFCEDANRLCNQKRDIIKKFRKFFEQTLVNPLPSDLKKLLDEIYNRRSKYVHKALLDGYGIRGIYSWDFDRRLKANAELRSFERLVNAALIQWLIKI